MNWKNHRWTFTLNGHEHEIELRELPSWSFVRIAIDGTEKLSRLLSKKDYAFTFPVDGAKVVVEFDGLIPSSDDPETEKLRADCFVNGLSATDGQPPQSAEQKQELRRQQEKLQWDKECAGGLGRYLWRQVRFTVFLFAALLIFLIVFYIFNHHSPIVLIGCAVCILYPLFDLFSSWLSWKKHF